MSFCFPKVGVIHLKSFLKHWETGRVFLGSVCSLSENPGLLAWKGG